MAAPLIRRVARHRSAVRYVSPRRPAYLSSAGPKYSCHQEREWTVAAITIRESIRESIREAIRESIIEAIREAIRGDERRSEAIRGDQAPTCSSVTSWSVIRAISCRSSGSITGSMS